MRRRNGSSGNAESGRYKGRRRCWVLQLEYSAYDRPT